MDMFGVTEIWLPSNETDSLIKDIITSEYTFHHRSRSKLCGGAVIFFVKECLDCSIC